MSYRKNQTKLYETVPHKSIPKHTGDSDKPLSYVPTSNVILRSDTAEVLATGEVFEITSDFKIVYTYMRERYIFNKSNNNPYYESWESVAAVIGKTKEVFKSKKDHKPTIKEVMVSLGLLKILDKKTRRSFHKEVCDVADVLDKVIFSNKKDKEYKDRLAVAREEYKESVKNSETLEDEVEFTKEVQKMTDTLSTYYEDPFELTLDQWDEGVPF